MDDRGSRTVSHASELGRWTMVSAEPDQRLRPHVLRYVGYDERTAGFTRRREPATPNAVLIIGFAPIEVSFPHLGTSARMGAFVSGISDSYAVVDSFGSQSGVQVDLTPLGAFTLLSLPLHEVTNRAVDLGDVLGPDGALLPERLHDAPDWTARFALLEGLLLDRFARNRHASPDVEWAWQRLLANEGRLRVGELADELGCSRRHLAARFREQVGLTPKTFSRLLRFSKASASLQAATDHSRPQGPRPGSSLSEIAYECGYYDQAHLNRDFREFAGLAPTELGPRLLPDEGGIADDRG